MQLTYDDLFEYQKNRPPYLMIDAATEVVPGVSAKSFKNLSDKDWFFACHFPGDPNMPGLLQIEALMQTAALAIVTLPGNKGRICYLTSADKLKFRKKIVSGDRLDIETKILSFKRGVGKCHGIGRVNGEFACEAEMNFVVPEILAEFSVTR
jgi:3-hydroxyacyl-[acyl-carrier-protein] dehydratase